MARRKQRDVRPAGGGHLFLQLQGVQELVLDFREVVSDDLGSLRVGQPATHTEPLEHRPNHLRRHHHHRHRGKGVKKHGAPHHPEAPHKLERHQHQGPHSQCCKRQEKPSKGFVSVVPPDERIQLPNQ